jgi:putative MFS transporter
MLSAAFLVAKGYNLSDTLLYVGVSTFGPVIGSVLLAPVADRFERRTLLLAWAGIMVAAGVGFYNSDQAIWLMVTSFAFNLGGALYTPTLNTHIAELFAPQARARATSWAWSVNRVGAALVPLVMLPWLRSDQGGLVFAIIVAALAGTALVVALGPRGEAGRAVN